MQQILLFRMLAEQELERLHHLQHPASDSQETDSEASSGSGVDESEGDEDDGTDYEDEDDSDKEEEDDLCDEDMGEDLSGAENDLITDTGSQPVVQSPAVEEAATLSGFYLRQDAPAPGPLRVDGGGCDADGAPAPPTPSHRSPRRSSDDGIVTASSQATIPKDLDSGVNIDDPSQSRNHPSQSLAATVSRCLEPIRVQQQKHPSWLAWGVHGMYGFFGGSLASGKPGDGGSTAPRPPTVSDVDELYRLLHSGGEDASGAHATAALPHPSGTVSPRSPGSDVNASSSATTVAVAPSSAAAAAAFAPVRPPSPSLSEHLSQAVNTKSTKPTPHDSLVAKIGVHVRNVAGLNYEPSRPSDSCIHHALRS